MKQLFSIIIAMMIMTTSAFAQQQQAQQQQLQIIKPTFTYGQIDLALKLMTKIELTGTEVDAFLEIRGILYPALAKGANDKKQLTDKVTLDMNVKQADNVLAFLNRTKLIGAEVQTFKEFKDAIFAAAAALKK
jgi:hypothetical protein